ncbi:MAG: hypothetical protein ACPGUC_09855 [Gammaproteobacteria bacterium]
MGFALFVTAVVTGLIFSSLSRCESCLPKFLKSCFRPCSRVFLWVGLIYLVLFAFVLAAVMIPSVKDFSFTHLEFILQRFFHPYLMAIFWGLVLGAVGGGYASRLMRDRERTLNALLWAYDRHPWPSLAGTALLFALPILCWLMITGGLQSLESSLFSFELKPNSDFAEREVRERARKSRRELGNSVDKVFSLNYVTSGLEQKVENDLKLRAIVEPNSGNPRDDFSDGLEFLTKEIIPLTKKARILAAKSDPAAGGHLRSVLMPLYAGFLHLAQTTLDESPRKPGWPGNAIKTFCDGRKTSAALLDRELAPLSGWTPPSENNAETDAVETEDYQGICDAQDTLTEEKLENIFLHAPHVLNVLGGLANAMQDPRRGYEVISDARQLKHDFVDWNLAITTASLHYWGYHFRPPVEALELYEKVIKGTTKMRERLHCDDTAVRHEFCNRVETARNYATTLKAFMLGDHYDELEATPEGRMWSDRQSFQATLAAARDASHGLAALLPHGDPLAIDGYVNTGVIMIQAAQLESRRDTKLGLLLDARSLFQHVINLTRSEASNEPREIEARDYLWLTEERLMAITDGPHGWADGQ